LLAISIRDLVLRDDFDGNATVQSRVAGAVHLAHPARADLGNDFIGTDTTAWRERQAGTGEIIRNLDVRVRSLLRNGAGTSDDPNGLRETLSDYLGAIEFSNPGGRLWMTLEGCPWSVVGYM
jgi:hypothetical protein